MEMKTLAEEEERGREEINFERMALSIKAAF